HLNRHYVLNAIPREKDVDVLGERALGAFYTGRNPVVPPPVGAVQTILATFPSTPSSGPRGNFSAEGGSASGGQLSTAKVAVVGLGFLIGKPIAEWLKSKTKELYLLDDKSDLGILKEVDLIISGTGHAGLLKPETLKVGAGVIDFGYAEGPDGELLGDLDASLSSVMSHLSFYTPTPGGTGPIVVALLFRNFYTLTLPR
ncbi:MAG: hypothetical protein Q8R20_02195, partial [Nanoarchaeota archaeon]|nr:hypothetical protein [Nanoarchaeota archaeon]